MYGKISNTGHDEFFFIAGDDGNTYYSRNYWVDGSFRNSIEVGARVEFQTRVYKGKLQAFAVRAEASAKPETKPEAKPSVRAPKADEHKDRRLILLHSILEEGRKPTDDEQKKLFAVWLNNPQGHLLTDQYDCSHCARNPRHYRERFDGLYVVTFGPDQPAVILCEKCRHRFFQLYPLCQAGINPLYDTLEQLAIEPNRRGWTIVQAANSHRRENGPRQKPTCKGSEKARKRNARLAARYLGGRVA